MKMTPNKKLAEEAELMWVAYIDTKDTDIKNALIEHYYPMVASTLNSMKTYISVGRSMGLGWDDLAQEGAIGMASVIDTYDPSKGLMFTTWAHQRVRGAIIDAVRNYSRKKRSHTEDVPGHTDVYEISYAIQDHSQEQVDHKLNVDHAVKTILSGLPERDRRILTLRHIENLTYTQIGQIVGVSESRICQLYNRVIAKIQTNTYYKRLYEESLVQKAG